jgi:hypothetical protein
MKTDNTAVTSAPKQVWVEPTLNNLSVSFATLAVTGGGMDGMTGAMTGLSGPASDT